MPEVVRVSRKDGPARGYRSRRAPSPNQDKHSEQWYKYSEQWYHDHNDQPSQRSDRSEAYDTYDSGLEIDHPRDTQNSESRTTLPILPNYLNHIGQPARRALDFLVPNERTQPSEGQPPARVMDYLLPGERTQLPEGSSLPNPHRYQEWPKEEVDREGRPLPEIRPQARDKSLERMLANQAGRKGLPSRDNHSLALLNAFKANRDQGISKLPPSNSQLETPATLSSQTQGSRSLLGLFDHSGPQPKGPPSRYVDRLPGETKWAAVETFVPTSERLPRTQENSYSSAAPAVQPSSRRPPNFSRSLPTQPFIAANVYPKLDWFTNAISCNPSEVLAQPSLLTKEQQQEIATCTTSLYKTLNLWQTRLLLLEPAESFESPLVSSLLDADVIDSPGLGITGTSEIVHYEALSYAWGDPTPVCSITCNGLQVGIGKELATALHHLRSSTVKRYIWCDAMCINQHDIPEKGRQVKQMLRIFEKADQVIAWIGGATAGTSYFYNALQEVNDESSRVIQHTTQRLEFASLVEAFEKHVESAWFVRTWVRQEVFAAKQLTIHFGTYKMDFITFVQKVDILLKLITYQGALNTVIPPTLTVYRHEFQHCGTDRHDFQMSAKLPSYTSHWRAVLRSGALFKVTDERDRVYGALGLLTSLPVKYLSRLPAPPEQLAADFPVNYDKQVHEVYQDVIKFLINSTSTLEILDTFRIRSTLHQDDRPSWARLGVGAEGATLALPQSQTDQIRVLKQEYGDVGRLFLSGRVMPWKLSYMDREKEMSHPVDRTASRYQKKKELAGYHLLFQELLRDAKERNTRTTSTDTPGDFVFAFPQVKEGKDCIFGATFAIRPKDLDREVASKFVDSSYIFACVSALRGDFLWLSRVHFLVPSIASMEDVVVSLHGSSFLHLLRPSSTPGEYTHVGIIAAVAPPSQPYLVFANSEGVFPAEEFTAFPTESFFEEPKPQIFTLV